MISIFRFLDPDDRAVDAARRQNFVAAFDRMIIAVAFIFCWRWTDQQETEHDEDQIKGNIDTRKRAPPAPAVCA
ncbi:MAG: hypothetical protein R3F54_03920 [Alphaproteobacteria bacterium]